MGRAKKPTSPEKRFSSAVARAKAEGKRLRFSPSRHLPDALLARDRASARGGLRRLVVHADGRLGSPRGELGRTRRVARQA
jgi:hypothetical protein